MVDIKKRLRIIIITLSRHIIPAGGDVDELTAPSSGLAAAAVAFHRYHETSKSKWGMDWRFWYPLMVSLSDDHEGGLWWMMQIVEGMMIMMLVADDDGDNHHHLHHHHHQYHHHQHHHRMLPVVAHQHQCHHGCHHNHRNNDHEREDRKHRSWCYCYHIVGFGSHIVGFGSRNVCCRQGNWVRCYRYWSIEGLGSGRLEWPNVIIIDYLMSSPSSSSCLPHDICQEWGKLFRTGPSGVQGAAGSRNPLYSYGSFVTPHSHHDPRRYPLESYAPVNHVVIWIIINECEKMRWW